VVSSTSWSCCFLLLPNDDDSNTVTVDNVGSYAGLLVSSFMLGRTLTSYAWGMAADVYGRTFVLKATLILAAIFSLLFRTTSSSFAVALIWRFLMGMSNGTISAVKTMVTEVSYGNEVVERRIMGIVVGMRSWGYLICPAIGGTLTEPLTQYPQFLSTAALSSLEWKKMFIMS
jgi:MFS family permease